MQNTQQKLQVKLKNIPTDASQVCSSISLGLNKEETLSVQDKVLACNSLDVNHSQHTGSQDLRVLDIVYVNGREGIASNVIPSIPPTNKFVGFLEGRRSW